MYGKHIYIVDCTTLYNPTAYLPMYVKYIHITSYPIKLIVYTTFNLLSLLFIIPDTNYINNVSIVEACSIIANTNDPK